MDVEWQIDTNYANPGKFKKFSGAHCREFASLNANLDKIMRILKGGQKVGGFRVNFFRSEGGDVYRIGQIGVPSAKESRLYVHPDEQNRVMYVLNIGDKDTQPRDVNESKDMVKAIRSAKVASTQSQKKEGK